MTSLDLLNLFFAVEGVWTDFFRQNPGHAIYYVRTNQEKASSINRQLQHDAHHGEAP